MTDQPAIRGRRRSDIAAAPTATETEHTGTVADVQIWHTDHPVYPVEMTTVTLTDGTILPATTNAGLFDPALIETRRPTRIIAAGDTVSYVLRTDGDSVALGFRPGSGSHFALVSQ